MKRYALLMTLGLVTLPLLHAAGNVTTLVMHYDATNGIVAPAGPSRVRVPYGEQVTLLAAPDVAGPVQWRKDGAVIPGATNATLAIASADSRDIGTYTVDGVATPPLVCTGIRLDVAPAEGTTTNFSSRLFLQPGADVQIVGFVVTGPTPKHLLFRAVGPSLAQFGVPHYAALPAVKVYDAHGEQVTWVRPDVVGISPPPYETYFQLAGAFPLDGGERAGIAYDEYSFPPGAYTLHVSDDSQAGGTVLVEVYELP